MEPWMHTAVSVIGMLTAMLSIGFAMIVWKKVLDED